MDNKIKLRVEEVKQNGFNVSIGDIFSKAWEIFSGIALYAISAIILTWLISFVINMILGLFISVPSMVITDPDDFTSAYASLLTPMAFVSNIISVVVSAAVAPITVSIFTMAKKFNNHQNSDFSDLFIHYKDGKFMPIFTTFLAVQILGAIGLILCVIPGLIFYVTSIFALPFVVFANFSTSDAIKSSVSVLFKNFGSAFVFCLASIGVIILGALVCGIGLLAAIPLVSVATYVFYEVVIGSSDNDVNEIDQIGTDIYKDNPYMK